MHLVSGSGIKSAGLMCYLIHSIGRISIFRIVLSNQVTHLFLKRKVSLFMSMKKEQSRRNSNQNMSGKLLPAINSFLFGKNITDGKLLFSHIIWLPYHLVTALMRRDWLFFQGFFLALTQLNIVSNIHDTGQRKFLQELIVNILGRVSGVVSVYEINLSFP